LEDENATDVNLSTLVSIKGKGWTYTNAAGAGTYKFSDTATVASITFSAANRTVSYGIDCQGFKDTISKDKCQAAIGSPFQSTDDLNETLTF
jgi:hypothetical protein